METQVIYNSDLHFEHTLWKNELLFWKDEIKSFQNRLKELSNRWTDKKVLKKLSEFQHSFAIHKKHIDDYLDEINGHELNIAEHYQIHVNAIDIPDLKKHNEFRSIMETERGIFNELKKEFFKFLAEYM
jgi:hypothetical protein